MTIAHPVGLAEIARLTGRSPETIKAWRRRYPDFPAPAADLAMGPVWDWPDVDRWRRERWPAGEGHPGRPPARGVV